MIIGAAVLALIIVGIGAAVVVNRSGNSAGGAADPQDPGAAPAAAGKPSDAVKLYLEALAAGKAETALALSDTQAADKTFLNDAVLADSNARAPITEINVPEVTDENAYSLDASYRLGDQPVNESFNVKKAGSTWKVDEGFAEVNLTSLRKKTLPMVINKVPVTTDKIRLFPGSYVFTSGNANIDYGQENVLLVESPSAYPRTTGIEPTLTAAGIKAFDAAIVTKLQTCTPRGTLKPAGCPNAVRVASYQKVDTETVQWELDSDPTANLKPRLDYENPAIAEASGSIPFKFKATGTQFDREARFNSTVNAFAKVSANLTQTPIKVVFTN
ncbi:MAG TPA: hypothetical protein VF657_03360 [Actinoplanes sp.]